MKVFGNKRNESSSKVTSEKDQKRSEGYSADDMEIIEAPVTNKANGMSTGNRAGVIVCVFIMSGYNQTDLFVKIRQIEILDILRCDAGLSHLALLPASPRIYCFCYSRGTLSVDSHRGVSTDDVTTQSTVRMTAVSQVLNNGAKVLFLGRLQRLRAMRQLHVVGDIR